MSKDILKIRQKAIKVSHVEIELAADFDQYTKSLEDLLGRYSETVVKMFETNPEAAEKRLKRMEGAEGLMLFSILEHGKLLNIYGLHRKAKLYVIGNPLIAASMTRYDLRAALYAPLRVLIYQNKSNETCVEYDLPSPLFGQFRDPEIDTVAHSLNSKLKKVLESAYALSHPIKKPPIK